MSPTETARRFASGVEMIEQAPLTAQAQGRKASRLPWNWLSPSAIGMPSATDTGRATATRMAILTAKGSVAVAILSKLGYHVIASTGRTAEADYLKSLGAAEIIDRAELSGPTKPIAKERWAAGIDSVGSTTLANVLSMTKYDGAIASCGLAQGMDLPSSVAPFILRGVALLGIDSVMCRMEWRREAWQRLARDLDREKLKTMTTEIPLAKVIETAPGILAGKVRGRIVVRVAD